MFGLEDGVVVNRTCSWQRHGSRTLCLALTLNLCKNNNTLTSRSPVTADTHHPGGEQRLLAVIVKMTFNLCEYYIKYVISLSHKKIQKLQRCYLSSSVGKYPISLINGKLKFAEVCKSKIATSVKRK